MKFHEISEVPAAFHEISCSDTFRAARQRRAKRSTRTKIFHEISLKSVKRRPQRREHDLTPETQSKGIWSNDLSSSPGDPVPQDKVVPFKGFDAAAGPSAICDVADVRRRAAARRRENFRHFKYFMKWARDLAGRHQRANSMKFQ